MKYKIILSIIIIFGFLIRLIGINSPNGLTYDELFSLNMANTPLNDFFEKLINTDYHPPLYYLFLKVWVLLFGCSDIILQLPSVIFSMLNIPILYLIGKSYNSRCLGLILAGLYAFTFTFVYKAQDVRFYQLACFEASLIILFCLRYLKSFKLKYLVLLTLAEIFLLYTLTLGSLFIFINSIIILILILKNKQILKQFFISRICLLVIYSGQFYITISQIINSKQTLLSNPWDWIFHSDITQSMMKFTELVVFPLPKIISYQYMPYFLFVFFAGIGLFKAIKEKNKLFIYIYSFFNCFFLLVFLLMKLDILKLSGNINYFAILAILNLIFVSFLFSKRKIILIIILLLQILHLQAAILDPIYGKKTNTSRFKAVANHIKLSNNQNILLFAPYGDKLFSKYIKNMTPFGINGDELFTMSKYENKADEIFDFDFKNTTLIERKTYLDNYLIQKRPTNNLVKKYKIAVSKLKKGDYFIVVAHNNRLYEQKYIDILVNEYKNQFPYSNLTMAKIALDVIYLLDNDKRLKFDSEAFIDNEWIIIMYQKR